MEQEMTAVMAAAMEARQRDAMFRRYVDSAVSEAMRHADHIESEVDKRDFYHVATVAAMATLRLALDGDHLLKSMEFERDAAKKLAHDAALQFPSRLIIKDPAA